MLITAEFIWHMGEDKPFSPAELSFYSQALTVLGQRIITSSRTRHYDRPIHFVIKITTPQMHYTFRKTNSVNAQLRRLLQGVRFRFILWKIPVFANLKKMFIINSYDKNTFVGEISRLKLFSPPVLTFPFLLSRSRWFRAASIGSTGATVIGEQDRRFNPRLHISTCPWA